ncbi:bifunctional hydroxymethylpyrimidine kinase/phosphomethylpyrimidine kinase [Duganella callida]|uniref:hydroxymethylpyrimidine kinase n=1 Tax=Duganella callida TaxID=2561932 RepID=A0A4Y9SJS8_9BURK|nr:hydroxymethylpyrimidine/phosphomethylpyrimidine kinase [Duganella callida]TFW26550.1 hydroxymethylpyrimidine/phosphomethylpyrimidine kinase [Duganella callida]
MTTRAGTRASAEGAVVRRHCVLVFAGLDPSGGAGLTADAQAIAALGAHALTVCTALTVQDNDRVYDVQPVQAELVSRQACALTDKMAISAIKIGITGSAANARAIAQVIEQLRAQQPDLPVVLDPVLASGHGDLLSRDDAVEALAPLLALTTIITPNGPEAAALTGAAQADEQAAILLARGCRQILITGGHGDGAEIINRWYGPQGRREWRWPRLPGDFHGSGCTLAAAIAAIAAVHPGSHPGSGLPLRHEHCRSLDYGSARDAMEDLTPELERAQHFTYLALRDAYAIADGQRVPLRHFL